MSVSTRTRKAPVKPVSAEKVVSTQIERNTKYVSKAPTANLAAFAEFVRNENKDRFATKAEIEAFDLGIRLAGLRASFQKDRKDGKVAATVSFADYAIESSGVTVPSGKALDALKAGIGSYTRYVVYRNSRTSSAATAE